MDLCRVSVVNSSDNALRFGPITIPPHGGYHDYLLSGAQCLCLVYEKPEKEEKKISDYSTRELIVELNDRLRHEV